MKQEIERANLKNVRCAAAHIVFNMLLQDEYGARRGYDKPPERQQAGLTAGRSTSPTVTEANIQALEHAMKQYYRLVQ
jgi:hypothetical protein